MPTFLDRLLARTPRLLHRPVEVVARTGQDTIDNRLPGLAAEIAFWALLSLPALLLAAIAATGVIGDNIVGGDWQDQLVERTVEVARLALTQPTIEQFVRPVLEELLVGGSIGLISLSFAAAVWTASRAVKTVLAALVLVSERPQPRQGWKDRLLGFGITLGGLLFGIVLLPLLLVGPALGEQLDEITLTNLAGFAEVWRMLYWPVIVVVGTLTIALLYHLGVPGKTRWRHEIPGAVLATSVWLAGSGGLRLYGVWLLDGESVYGSLAGPIVLLLWLWLTGFAVLLGVQFNAQVQRTAS